MLKRGIILLLLFFCGISVSPSAPAEIVLENAQHRVVWNPDGTLSFFKSGTPQPYLASAKLTRENGRASILRANHPTFGKGKTMRLDYATGAQNLISVFDNLSFVLVQQTLLNASNSAITIDRTTPLSAEVGLRVPASRLKSFGTAGLTEVDENPGSYAWLSIVEPDSRNGVVLGYLTHDRGSGVLFSSITGETARVEAQIHHGRLGVPARTTLPLETLAVGYFDDARLGLESWAAAVGKHYRVEVRPVPTGYCTWYSRPHGGASDEKHLAELAEFSATNLAPFGFSVVQIDDKWQDGHSTNGPKRNFTTHRADGPYPNGMKPAADHIKSLGLVPGIWFMPFAGTYYDPFFADKQDWFVKREDGRPYETSWGGTCLDMTHPGARKHLQDVARRITHDWGYEYLKIDGLWTGTGTRQQYVNSGYKEDNMGDAVLHNPEKTNIEAYRDGLKLLRKTVGKDVFILGCNGPQNMRSYSGAFGLVDAMRVGPDNGSGWKSLLRGPLFGTRHYFLHGRLWLNDPDPIYVRADMPTEHARLICSWVAVSGQLNLSSEWLPGLPPDRLDILKRTMPAHNLQPRPVDLFNRDLPEAWLLTAPGRNPTRHVVALFNWEETDREFSYPLEKIGLAPGQQYELFDYWSNQLLEPATGQLKLQVPKQSCRILTLRPAAIHPQVLSTSRHVTQGVVDLPEENWDAKRSRLSGRSLVVAGEPYELRIKGNAASAKITRGGKNDTIDLHQDGDLVRATIRSSVSGSVSWAIDFR